MWAQIPYAAISESSSLSQAMALTLAHALAKGRMIVAWEDSDELGGPLPNCVSACQGTELSSRRGGPGVLKVSQENRAVNETGALFYALLI